jgi:hypothetical protein
MFRQSQLTFLTIWPPSQSEALQGGGFGHCIAQLVGVVCAVGMIDVIDSVVVVEDALDAPVDVWVLGDVGTSAEDSVDVIVDVSVEVEVGVAVVVFVAPSVGPCVGVPALRFTKTFESTGESSCACAMPSQLPFPSCPS